jgi:hypothetical protein
MIKRLLFFLFLCGTIQVLKAQETKERDLPVRESFASGVLIDNQTTWIPTEKTFEFVIQHKFGEMTNGFSDLFGIYAPGSNIRLGLNYVPLKNMQIGYGLSRIRMYSDFSFKYTILEQTRRNRIPVAVGIYTNLAIDSREKEAFGIHYNLFNRISYFSQLIIGHKFGERASIQANASFTHFNITEPGIDHDKLSVGINGRIVINYKSSILFQYDMPLLVDEITEHNEYLNPAQPNFGIGWEVRTSAHAFHLYVSSTTGLTPQYNALYNQNQWQKGQLMFGFTITRMYNFF